MMFRSILISCCSLFSYFYVYTKSSPLILLCLRCTNTISELTFSAISFVLVYHYVVLLRSRPIKLSCRSESCLVDLVLATLEVRRTSGHRNRSTISSNPNTSGRETAAERSGQHLSATSAASAASSVAEAAARRAMNTSNGRYERSASSSAGQSRNTSLNSTSAAAAASSSSYGNSSGHRGNVAGVNTEPSRASHSNKRTTAAGEEDEDDYGDDESHNQFGSESFNQREAPPPASRYEYSHPSHSGEDDGGDDDEDREAEWDASAAVSREDLRSAASASAFSASSAAVSGSPIDAAGRSIRYSTGANNGGTIRGGKVAAKKRKILLLESSDEEG
jgi:hypothetical protein